MVTSTVFGELIQRVRKQSRMTQVELAAVCGVGVRFIRELESGKPTCQLGKAFYVAQMLGITIQLHSPLMKDVQ